MSESNQRPHTIPNSFDRLGDELLNAPVMRPWPPTVEEARIILDGEPYEVLERIGHGGMGAVFLVKNQEPGMNRLEAVKIRRPEARDNDQFHERFLREISTLAELKHPGLTTVYRSGESTDGYLWFSMEYLDGKTLADLTGDGGETMPVGRVLDITRQLCQTLVFIHRSGRLHRDLKPANIMVCDDGGVRVLDFGIVGQGGRHTSFGRIRPGDNHDDADTCQIDFAGARHASLTQPGESPNTPDFAAPEQKAGGVLDQRTDLYGLGRIVNAMLRPTGTAGGANPHHYPDRLLDLVDALVSFDPDDRPDSAEVVMEKLGRLEPGASGFWGRDRCPFRGLEAYQAEHAEIFFGRDETIRRGLEILRQSTNTASWCGFLLLSGASGSGKSSLARAGLGPALLGGHASSGTSPVTIAPVVFDLGSVRPENACLLNPLARAIAVGIAGVDPDRLAAALRDRHADLAFAIGLPEERSGRTTCCLILDQLENFFRADLPRSSRIRFLAAVARLARTPGVVVLATLRADYYQYCAGYPALMDLKEGRHLDVCVPQAWELAALLRLSARASDLVFECGPDGRGLDDVLLEHARRNPQALPLLSYVLEQLWEQRDRATNTLKFADYEALGGFEGAIAAKAQATFDTFAAACPADPAAALADLLDLLVDAEEGGTGLAFARRIAAEEELGAASTDVRQLAEYLVGARLCVRSATGLALAHDAMLSDPVAKRWQALGQWLENSARDLVTRRRVSQRRQDWEKHEESVDLLLPDGSLLAEATRLLQDRPAIFPKDDSGFIRLSSETAGQSSRRARQRRRLVVLSLSLLALVASAAAVWAFQRERDAMAARDLAEAEKSKALLSEQAATHARDTAEKLINSMIYDLRDKLEPLGRIELLDDVSKQAEDYFKNNPAKTSKALRNEAAMWNNRGDVLQRSGNLKAARKAFQNAMEIRQGLVEAYSKDSQMWRDLSVCYENLGGISLAEGDIKTASEAYHASLEICLRLAKLYPRNTQTQRDLSISYDRIGETAEAEMDLKKAGEAYEKSHGICQSIVKEDRSNLSAQRDLAMSFENLGDIAKISGNFKDASELFIKSHEIRQYLARVDPSHSGVQRELSISYGKLGDIALVEGDLKWARDAFEQSHKIRLNIFDVDSYNVVARRDLSVSYFKLGDIDLSEGDLKGARKAFEKAIEIDKCLADADFQNFHAQRDLSISYDRLGEVAMAEGDLKAAGEAYEKSHEISIRLAEAEPRNLHAQRDLSFSYERLGEVAMAESDLKAAGEAYRKSLEISQRLAKATTSAQAQQDLSCQYNNLAWYHLHDKNFPLADEFARKAIARSHDSIFQANLAHALLFQGKYAEAEKIHVQHKGTKVDGQTWEHWVAEDFRKLRKAGIVHPDMKMVESLLGIAGGLPKE